MPNSEGVFLLRTSLIRFVFFIYILELIQGKMIFLDF